MRKREAQRFPHYLRRGRGSQKLAAAAGRSAGAAQVQRRGAAGIHGRLRVFLGRRESEDVAPVAESQENTGNPSKEESSK